MSVKSPINGSITKQKLLLGQYIELNETPIEIFDTNDLRLSLQVFENAIAEIKILILYALREVATEEDLPWLGG